MDMMISFSNELSCTSSRFCCSHQEMKCFYSVPTSPTFKLKTLTSHFASQTSPTTPTTHEDDANSNVDEFEFEFETSRRFNLSDFDVESRHEEDDKEEQKLKQRPQTQQHEDHSLPSMAFADELFCDGKVLPLLPPLKLPPRLQNGSDNKTNVPSGSTMLSSTSSSPRSLGSARRLPFVHRSFWNDDFDPFMEALEVVKEGEGKREKSTERLTIRRTRSLSPFRVKSPNRPNGPHYGPNQPLKPESTSSNMVLCEPKGLVYARRVRLVGVEKNGPIEPNKTKEERKRKKIRRFLLFGKESVEEEKLKDEKVELGKLLGLNKDERVREVKKMTMNYYKPRLLFCLGYGGRYVK